MSYHMLIVRTSSDEEPLLDLCLGSAVTVFFNWESVGQKLSLPIISNLTERVESEEGFELHSDNLICFRNEMEVFERYWVERSAHADVPEFLLKNIRAILVGITNAIENGLTLMVF